MGKNANGGEADILDKVKRVAQGGRGSGKVYERKI